VNLLVIAATVAGALVVAIVLAGVAGWARRSKSSGQDPSALQTDFSADLFSEESTMQHPHGHGHHHAGHGHHSGTYGHSGHEGHGTGQHDASGGFDSSHDASGGHGAVDGGSYATIEQDSPPGAINKIEETRRDLARRRGARRRQC
jgi:hypothetical protein